MSLSYYSFSTQPPPIRPLTPSVHQQLLRAAQVQAITKKSPYKIISAESCYLLPLTENLMFNRVNGISFGIRLPQDVLWPIEPKPNAELLVRSNGIGKVGVLSQTVVRQLMLVSAENRLHILKSLLTSSTYLASELEQYACNTLSGRIAKLLLDLSHTTHSHILRYSHAQLADLLNAQRESVSMIVGQFRRNGWVSTSYGCITVENSAELEKLATNY